MSATPGTAPAEPPQPGRGRPAPVRPRPPLGGADPARLTIWVRGRVQGVGFRWWTRSRARELGLVGSAANREDGRVEVVAEGERADCERLLALLSEQPSSTGRPGHVSGVTVTWGPARGGLSGFVER